MIDNITMKKNCFFYIGLIGYALFDVTIKWMSQYDIEPSLLPLKIVGLYIFICIGIFVIYKICFRGDLNKRSNSGKSSLDIPSVAIGFLGIITDELIFLKLGEVVRIDHIADCNTVKLMGVTITDTTAMIGYYLEQLVHILPEISIGYLLPVLFFAFTYLLLYQAACRISSKDVRKCRIIFTLGIVIFSVIYYLATGICDVQGDILDEKTAMGIWLPVLMVGVVFKICYKAQGQIKVTDRIEILCILLIGFATYLPVAVFCLVIGLAGAGYVAIIRYSGKIRNRTRNFWIFEILITGWLCLNPWTRVNFWDMFYRYDDQLQRKMAEQVDYCDIIAGIPVDAPGTKVLASDEIMQYLRAESLNVGLLYEIGIISSDVADQYYDPAVCGLYKDMQDPKDRLGQIVRIMKGHQCNYLIIPLEADERWEMEQSGSSVIRENDKFVLYYCPVI